MNVREALAQLEKLGDEKVRTQNKKRGAGDNQFGVKHGDIRVLAKKIKNHPKLRKRAIALGEKLGVFRDYPVSKGCTSPFAPIWINEMVRRQK